MPKTMNKLEQTACYRLFTRTYNTSYDTDNALCAQYRAFRRKVYFTHMGCWIVPNWHGMTIGIERDGYTHS